MKTTTSKFLAPFLYVSALGAGFASANTDVLDGVSTMATQVGAGVAAGIAIGIVIFGAKRVWAAIKGLSK